VCIQIFKSRVQQIPGLRACVNMSHIKTHYFTSHPHLNTYAIIPGGLLQGDADSPPWWERPHDRKEKFPAVPAGEPAAADASAAAK
jgi:hypothetical protein